MGKTKLISLVLLLFAAGVVVSFLVLRKQPQQQENQNQEQKQVKEYSITGTIKRLDQGKIILEVDEALPAAEGTLATTVKKEKIVVPLSDAKVIQRVTVGGEISFIDRNLNYLRAGQNVVVYSQANPKDFEAFSTLKVEIF